MYSSLGFSLLLILLLQTLITKIGLLLFVLIVFVFTLLLISFMIRSLINRLSKSNDYFITNPLIVILISNIENLIINSLIGCLNSNNGSNDENFNVINEKNFCGNSLEIINESKSLAELITDNYINLWYKTISKENNDFLNDCEIILQQICINFFQKCEQKLNKERVLRKTLILFENHLKNNKSLKSCQSKDEINCNYLMKERERVALIVERALQLLAPEEVLSLTRIHGSKSNTMSTNPSLNDLSLVIMIKELLTQSVLIPITNLITDPLWIYSYIIRFCRQSISNEKLSSFNDKNESENQSSNSSELTLRVSQLKDIQTYEEDIALVSQTDCCQHNSEHISQSSLNLLPTVSHDLSRVNSCNTFDFSGNYDQKDNSRVDYLSDLSGNESSDELAVEALETEDKNMKLFTNLVISKTQQMKDPSNVLYILYCIEYEASFEEMEEWGSVSISISEPNVLRKSFAVYRRFSEFITLQKVLERNKQIKKHLKGIKKPSSIQITAQNLFMNTKLDSSTIEFRRIFLQNFLKELCNRDSIARSTELQQFLAYRSDASIAFVKSKDHNILPLNIDGVFYKGVKGAISIIKTALPVEPQEGTIDPLYNDRIHDNEKITIKTIVSKVDNNNIMQLEKKLNHWNENKCDFTSIHFSYNVEETTLTETHLIDSLEPNELLGPRSRGDGCEANHLINCDIPVVQIHKENTVQSKLEAENNLSLSSQLINSIALSMTSNVIYVWQMITTKLIEIFFSPIIEKYVIIWLNEVMTKELILSNFHKLHLVVWPLSSNANYDEPPKANFEELINSVYAYIQNQLNISNPYLSYILKQKFFTKKLLSNILINLNSIQNNKICFYNFLEIILDEIE